MRLLFSNRGAGFMGLLMAGLLLTGCGSFMSTPNPTPPSSTDIQDGVTNAAPDDPLRIGDKVKIELTGTPTPIYPSEQAIKDDGSVTLTYIGSVKAAGKTPLQLEADIQKMYVPDYYRQVTVSVMPMDRFFYVGGQVNRPNQQLYVGAVTVTKAIQAAGDFTDFADRKHIQITRIHGKVEFVNYDKILKHPEQDTPIYPGDRIDVGRRW